MYEDRQYFKKHKYRDPGDYLVRSYALPKIEFMRENGCFYGNNLTILDVGSGNGTFSIYFREYAKQIACMDSSEQLLKDNKWADFKAMADAYRIPFKDSQFDLVFAANLLHHIDSPQSVIQEMKRCANKYLVFIEPNRYNPLMFIFGIFVPAERGTLVSFRKRWQALIRAAGLRIRAVKTTGMISQQNTPKFLVPLLKIFDFDFCLGEYVMFICEK